MPISIVARSGEELSRIRSRAGDVGTLGKIVARILEQRAQRAFNEQKLGDFTWPERYPTQEDPFVNLASLVNWTNEGGTILSRHFDRRPALKGTGDLMQSISGEVKGDLVEIGSSFAHAGLHQWGGSSSLKIKASAKQKIAEFIGEEEDGKGGWKKRSRLGSRQKDNREKYWDKLFPLLSKQELTTQVNQRPFLGMTTEDEQEMAENIEHYVATGDE